MEAFVSSYDTAKDCNNLVEHAGHLTWLPGFAVNRPDTPGVGEFDFPVGDNGLGVTVGPAADDEIQPIVLVARTQLFDTSSSVSVPLFVTATYDLATKGASETGHAFTINATNKMVEIPFTPVSPPELSDREELYDWTPVPWGGTGGEGMLCFTNNVDPIFIWDLGAGAAPGEIRELDTTSFASLRAKSVISYNGRILIFNVTENSVNKPTRLSWTSVLGTGDGAFFDPGGGAMDITELTTQGQRVETIGDFVACYSQDGVVFLTRTNIPGAPFKKTFKSNLRGLLSTHALTPIGRDIHFGIFTDGWWILDSGGNWNEVGTLKTPNGEQHKFKKTFYELLDMERISRLFVLYDAERDYVYITFPVAGDRAKYYKALAAGNTIQDNARTWVLDLRTNNVWPQDFGFTCGSSLTDIEGAAPRFVDMPTAFENHDIQFRELNSSASPAAVQFGDTSGFINIFTDDDWLRRYFDVFIDIVEVAFFYQSYQVPNENPNIQQALTRIGFESSGKLIKAPAPDPDEPASDSVDVYLTDDVGHIEAYEGLHLPVLADDFIVMGSRKISTFRTYTNLGVRFQSYHPLSISSMTLETRQYENLRPFRNQRFIANL
jgi:hypothetical protein